MRTTVRRGRRWAIGALLAGVLVLTSGFTSCAGTTGPLLAPMQITPGQLLLRTSLSNRIEAIGLARIDGGEEGDRYTVDVALIKDPPASWLTVDLGGTNLTLRARPDGLEEGLYLADVTVTGRSSGATAVLHVEFNVIR
ncbi:MAG: hypothetical protein AB7R55_22555 [Gemmatimonadales bacterium]